MTQKQIAIKYLQMIRDFDNDESQYDDPGEIAAAALEELEQPSDLDLIAQEREKQISKGYTVEHDQQCNPECQLAAIASDLCFPYEIEHAPEPPVPINWNPEYWKKLINLPYKDRLRIAGAMLAGELDRIIHLQNKEA